jgi:hypothetical protein
VTGFIRGLFGSKSNGAEEVPQPKEAFYLSDDDAKTFGNIDYMRSSVKTRRTFPKQVVGEDNEFIQEVSATKKLTEAEKPKQPYSPFNGYALQPTEPSSNGASSNGASSNGASAKPAESSSPAPSAPRRTDSSMDMFRNMARDIKKKG